MDDVSVWFFGWLRYHQRLLPGRWVPYDSPDAGDVYLGWIEAFEKARATDDLARMATRRLQAEGPGWPTSHLSKLLPIIAGLRRELFAGRGPEADPAHDPALVEASLLSADCPECGGTGWAKRRILWHSLPRPFCVDLFCRCYAGRYRKANDVELLRGERVRLHDDLQARSELWDPALWHHSWDDYPCGHDLETPEGCEGKSRYVLPGEDAPEPIRPAALARPLGFELPRPDRTPVVMAEPSPEAAAAGAAERSRQLAELAGRLPGPGTVSEIAAEPEPPR